ncbi:E3 ubiquitin-protein ligase WAV3 [Coffea arabica]|uniref:E3 ubiquitin-protein ligase WAV3 n=1 Tax=Coffea arabica TaxID=13443 RepID=A0A6P6UKD8_COFAR|nr:E3 ubiquitin-protein ligase WAV3 [Coffea arabica]
MGTGWRRAFCTTIPRDTEKLQQQQQQQNQTLSGDGDQIPSPSPSHRSCAKFGFLSSGSNPSTPRLQSQSPRLRCKTCAPSSNNDTPLISPQLHCKTTNNTPKSSTKSQKPRFGSNPSSPRSPFKILKNSLRLTRNSCGVCMQSVKAGQGMAIYTAECSHSFHFPCIAAHVRKQSTLICPVCNSSWKDVPLLAIHKLQQQSHQHQGAAVEQKDIMVDTTTAQTCYQETKSNHSQPHNFLPNLKTKQQQEKIPNAKQQLNSRPYNDDEPLVSPTAGVAKFIPIPEANEEDQDGDDVEVEEFQGFFVNPVPSDDALGSCPNKDFRNVEVSLLPEAAVVSATRTHETLAFVLKVKAPPPPPPLAHNSNSVHFKDPARRAPIDLVTVLDVSGSMIGAKLHMLKRAMRLVVSSLGSADRLSIVAFSATPKRLMPLRRMNPQGQRSARRIIDRLVCSHGTSVGEALKKATKILDDRRERNPVASIMLLSDGQDEKVQTNGSDNQRQRSSSRVSSTRFSHIEIPVHSSGFGRKAGYSKEPAEDAFSKCVGGLLSVVVQDLRIQLGFSSGSDPAEITAVYSCNGRPTALGSDCIRLGDLYAEEEKELLVEMRVPASTFGTHHVLSVKCYHKDPATQEAVSGREQALLVPRPQAVRASMPRIERLRNLFITTRAIAESRRLIEQNELTSAMHLLSSARGLLAQSRCESAGEYVRGLEAELAEVQWRRQHEQQLMEQQLMIQRRKVNEKEAGLFLDENGEPLTPTSAWRAAEKLAKVAMMKKSVNRVSDLHGFENARF